MHDNILKKYHVSPFTVILVGMQVVFLVQLRYLSSTLPICDSDSRLLVEWYLQQHANSAFVPGIVAFSGCF